LICHLLQAGWWRWPGLITSPKVCRHVTQPTAAG
jgi:hypothetical protein